MQKYTALTILIAIAGCAQSSDNVQDIPPERVNISPDRVDLPPDRVDLPPDRVAAFASASSDDVAVNAASLAQAFQATTDTRILRLETQISKIDGISPDGIADGLLTPADVSLAEPSMAVFEIRTIGEDDYEIVAHVDGDTRTFSDGNGFGIGLGGNRFYLDTPEFSTALESLDGHWKDVFAGNGTFAHLVRFELNTLEYSQDLPSSYLAGVIGLPTTQLPMAGGAHYQGALEGIIDYAQSPEPGNFDLFDEDRFTIQMDVDLAIEFANPVISGSLDAIMIDGDPVEGAFLVEDAPVSVTGFDARIVVDPAGCTETCLTLESGALSGALFGPNGLEAGGTGDFVGSDANGIGFVATSAWAASSD